MLPKDINTVQPLATYATFGAFAGMAIIGWTVWFDVSSIGTLLAASDNALLANLFMGGAMIKGAVLGFVVGSARLSARRERRPLPALSPALGTARV
jgi:hypothetical protein